MRLRPIGCHGALTVALPAAPGEKPKTCDKERRCAICGTILSSYNLSPNKCWPCAEKENRERNRKWWLID